ncbi:unnamed protein product [Auanema sp. JU1783]|nr:unnamed protein product [Auanema sp. JU1783]
MDFDYNSDDLMSDSYSSFNYLEQKPGVSQQKIVRLTRYPLTSVSRGGDLMLAATSAASSANSSVSSYSVRDRSTTSTATCAVCGDGTAKLHYGVLACYGCKGFFRRTLTGKYRYVCRFGNNCIVDKYQRNSCRYCRFTRCIEVGMDPKAVRPDRDITGKQRVPRIRKKQIDEDLLNHVMRLQGDDWSRKLPVEHRIMLMQLMNIENKVAKGDLPKTNSHKNYVRDSKNISLREMFEQKPLIDGRRTEMSYEPYRMTRTEELSEIAHRRAIAAVDWVENLTEIAEIISTDDKVSLVKACYSPLTIFNFSARTAQNTTNPDILCLCSHSYVPRQLPPEFNETNHLSNILIDRTLNELVAPLRKLSLKEEEIVTLKSIIILNPNAKGLSTHAKQAIADLRDKMQDMLFQIVKEIHPNSPSGSSRFGNLLLLLPTITTLSGLMSENMQFCQAFGGRHSGDPLLSEMFGDQKPVFDDSDMISSSVSPPLFDPADISLQSISPPLLNSPKSVMARPRVSRRETATQTDLDRSSSPLSHSRSSNSLISGGYSPPVSLSMNSPFHTLLDDESFSPGNDMVNGLVDLGNGDLFSLIQ